MAQHQRKPLHPEGLKQFYKQMDKLTGSWINQHESAVARGTTLDGVALEKAESAYVSFLIMYREAIKHESASFTKVEERHLSQLLVNTFLAGFSWREHLAEVERTYDNVVDRFGYLQ